MSTTFSESKPLKTDFDIIHALFPIELHDLFRKFCDCWAKIPESEFVKAQYIASLAETLTSSDLKRLVGCANHLALWYNKNDLQVLENLGLTYLTLDLPNLSDAPKGVLRLTFVHEKIRQFVSNHHEDLRIKQQAAEAEIIREFPHLVNLFTKPSAGEVA